MQNVHHTAEDGVTAFQGTEAALQQRCKDAKLSPAEFQRKLSRCSLSTCRGMCCYGGVSVDDGTAAVLQRLSSERASDFRDMGLELPETVVAPTECTPLRPTRATLGTSCFMTMGALGALGEAVTREISARTQPVDGG
jgi:hypothetical protein